MKRNNIWLFILSPLLVLTGVPANAGIIDLTDLLAPGTCSTALAAGCWTLQNQNGDGTVTPDSGGVGQTGTGSLLSGLTVIGSDVNTVDAFGAPNGGALFDPSTAPNGFDPALLGVDGFSGDGTDINGTPFSTITLFTTVISDATSGDLTFNWSYSTLDAGSFYDQAGYYQCSATAIPGVGCAFYQLTMSYDALAGFVPSNDLTVDNPLGIPGAFGGSGAAPDPLSGGGFVYAYNLDGTLNTAFNAPTSPGFAETGTATVSLSAGDTFGAYVLSLDNANGAGTISFASFASPTPEPASFLLIGGGLLALGGAGRRARRRRQEEKTAV
jgi:hypothetical protein